MADKTNNMEAKLLNNLRIERIMKRTSSQSFDYELSHHKSISTLVSYHRKKVTKSRTNSLPSSQYIKPDREKKLKKKTQKNCRMCCFILTLIIGLIASFLIPLAWESCQEVHQLNDEYAVNALSSVVFGQELAIHSTVQVLQTHLKSLKSDNYKPLLLSFHGSSGVGKTLLASQLSHILPANTRVHKYYPLLRFKGEETAEMHARAIWIWMLENLSVCPWNIIIVDDAQDITEEAQKAFKITLAGMKDTLYRKLIVIFVSNLYSLEINNLVFNRVKLGGQSTFSLSDFSAVFEHGPSNWLVEMYREGLLDAFVPFLPLDRNNVLKCIEQELKRYKKLPHKEIVDKIVNDIVFYTVEEIGYQYSISGCKKVADKIAFWLNS